MKTDFGPFLILSCLALQACSAQVEDDRGWDEMNYAAMQCGESPEGRLESPQCKAKDVDMNAVGGGHHGGHK